MVSRSQFDGSRSAIHEETLTNDEIALVTGEVAELINKLTNPMDDWFFLIGRAALVCVGPAGVRLAFLYTA